MKIDGLNALKIQQNPQLKPDANAQPIQKEQSSASIFIHINKADSSTEINSAKEVKKQEEAKKAEEKENPMLQIVQMFLQILTALLSNDKNEEKVKNEDNPFVA